jgi:hypothetical protein
VEDEDAGIGPVTSLADLVARGWDIGFI